MCPSDAPGKLKLSIESVDPGIEVFIVNGDLNIEDRGIGRFVTKPLNPGIYKIKAQAGLDVHEQLVVLRNTDQVVTIPRFAIASPAPLNATSKTHEYHIEAAAQLSAEVRVQVGTGSWIFVLSREWTPKNLSSESHFTPNANPAAGLSICDQDGIVIVALEAKALVAATPDSSAGCNIQVDPGCYRLKLDLPDGSNMQQSIVACPGWQTQVFLLQRDFDAVRRADLAKASILMSRGLGFHADDNELRQTELARLSLLSQRKMTPTGVRKLLGDKFDNPMLGILGAHLLLLEPTTDMQLLSEVVVNLKSLLNFHHPDVDALSLLVDPSSDVSVSVPPMLRHSWDLFVDATIHRPDIVPANSVAARAARRVCDEPPWFLWAEGEPTEIPEIEMRDDFDSSVIASIAEAEAAELPTLHSTLSRHLDWPTSTSSRLDSPFEAVRTWRASVGSARSSDLIADSGFVTAQLPAEESISSVIRALGIPRSTIENVFKSREPNDAMPDKSDDQDVMRE